MAYFPNLFGNSNDKFGKFAVWLITTQAVVCPNIRDLFTAGGKGQFVIKGKIYQNIPRVILNLFENYLNIIEIIAQTSAIELSEYWQEPTNERNKITDWINLVSLQASKIYDAKHLNIKEMLLELI